MPTRTVYVKESDLPTWDLAQKELGNVSQIVGDCIKSALKMKVNAQTIEKMEKIVLDFWDSNENPTIKKSFVGRWLIHPHDEVGADDTASWNVGSRYAVAQTKKGAIVAYVTHCNDGHAPWMTNYEDFEAFKGGYADDFNTATFPSNVLALTAAAIGESYEIELDI